MRNGGIPPPQESSWALGEDLGDSIAPTALCHMKGACARAGGRLPSLTSGWFLREGAAAAVPVRFTLVNACGIGAGDGAGDAYRQFLDVLLEVTALLESGNPEDSPDAFPPGNLDVAVYPWTARKRYKRGPVTGSDSAPAPLGQDECNSGVTIHYDNGGVSILVYRKEEAVKVLVHELLHAYGVGEWLARDARVASHLARVCAPGRLGNLMVNETAVECFAVCLASARVSRMTGEPLAGVLARCCAYGANQSRAVLEILHGGARQETAAYEYHVLKTHVLHRLAVDLDASQALSESGRIPSRDAVRGYFLSFPYHGNCDNTGPRHNPRSGGQAGAVVTLRMIPRGAEELVRGLAACAHGPGTRGAAPSSAAPVNRRNEPPET